MQDSILPIAAAIAFVNIVVFCAKIWLKKADPMNTASFLMFSCLQLIILFSTISEGKPYLYSLSFTVGTALILAVSLRDGKWRWKGVETFSAAGALASIYIWKTVSGTGGVICGVIAINLASIPMIKDTLQNPDRRSSNMFFIASASGLLTLIGTWPWTFGGSFFAGAGVIWNGFMGAINLRKIQTVERLRIRRRTLTFFEV